MKDQVAEDKRMDAETMFKAFVNSLEKRSSQWQARDEYLADIKQANISPHLSWTYKSKT